MMQVPHKTTFYVFNWESEWSRVMGLSEGVDFILTPD